MEGFSTQIARRKPLNSADRRQSLAAHDPSSEEAHPIHSAAEVLPGHLPEDLHTRAVIEERLFRDINREARAIECIVEGGHVRLKGLVRSYYRKQLAQEAALRTDGVRTVVNELEVLADEA